jgi:hypothetical protein
MLVSQVINSHRGEPEGKVDSLKREDYRSVTEGGCTLYSYIGVINLM